MTPAVTLLKLKKMSYKLHSYNHKPKSISYGMEAATALNLEPDRVFKTLVVELNGDSRNLGVALVPVASTLDLKRLAASVGAKSAAMAQPGNAQKATGYVLGGISPLGQKQQLLTVVDQTASCFETVYISAGKRGLELELKPSDLIDLTRAKVKKITA